MECWNFSFVSLIQGTTPKTNSAPKVQPTPRAARGRVNRNRGSSGRSVDNQDEIPPVTDNNNVTPTVPPVMPPNDDEIANTPPNNNNDHVLVDDTRRPLNSDPLYRQFESVLSGIRRQAEFIDSENFGAITYNEASVRLDRLDCLWKALDDMHLQLVGQLPQEHVAECQSHFNESEDLYFVVNSALRTKITALSPQEQRSVSVSEAGASDLEKRINVNVTIPERHQDIKNTWGTFDGSLLKWQSFHDRFVAHLHNKEGIPNAIKFALLKDSLADRAAQTLGEWHLTEDSYAEAWERLKQIYNKRYPIIREHLRQFERLPRIVGFATANQLQRLSNVTHETLRQLKAMQLPVDSWDLFIVHNLHERLDPDTAYKWEIARTSEEPKASEMLDFLDKEASACASNSESQGKPLESFAATKSDRLGRSNQRTLPSNVRSSTPYRKEVKSNEKHYPCEACNADHKVFDCDDYLSLSLNARWEFVRVRRLCANCLKRGHNVDNCFSITCNHEECKKKDPRHNSTLCPFKGKGYAMTVRNVPKDSYTKKE